MPSAEDVDRIKSVFKAALTGPNGSEMMEELVKTYVLRSNPHTDPNQLQRFEGRRDLVVLMMEMARDDPEVNLDYLIRLNFKLTRPLEKGEYNGNS